MTRCTFKQGKYNCGSYVFNLEKDDIDQGDLCDVHYWQDQAQKARADEREACLVGIQAEIDHAHLNKLRLTPLFGQRQGEIAVRASSLDSALYAIRARGNK